MFFGVVVTLYVVQAPHDVWEVWLQVNCVVCCSEAMLHLGSFTWHAHLLVPHWHLRLCAGRVTLSDQYQVPATHIVKASRSCVIHAERGTMLMLSGPLHFLGDVRLTGSLQVLGIRVKTHVRSPSRRIPEISQDLTPE